MIPGKQKRLLPKKSRHNKRPRTKMHSTLLRLQAIFGGLQPLFSAGFLARGSSLRQRLLMPEGTMALAARSPLTVTGSLRFST
jgi:hypothetical protein